MEYRDYDLEEICPHCDYVNEIDISDTKEHSNGKRTIICKNCGQKIFVCNLCDEQNFSCGKCNIED